MKTTSNVKQRSKSSLSADVLKIDTERVIEQIAGAIRAQVLGELKRRGAVVAVSGGIDSSVVTALCARALGPDRVFAVLMPETDSDPASVRLGTLLCDSQGVRHAVEDIGPVLETMGCYRRRDDFIRQVVPEYGPGYKSKLVIMDPRQGEGYGLSSLVVMSPDGSVRKVRLPLVPYLGIVAATNMKQRTRKQLEYYYADCLHYAVAGTPNRLEYDQGFFVKNGDGSADLKPIAHLYKSQVYQLAAALGVPSEILRRTPSTDTFSLAQSQEEFFFALPYDQMDLCLYALNHGISAEGVAQAIGLQPQEIERVYRSIEQKRRTTHYQQASPLVVETISEIRH
jgi:NAD+ synthase